MLLSCCNEVNMTSFKQVYSKRYKLACGPIEDTDQPTSVQSDQSPMDALWVYIAMGPTFLQAKN